jgi:hypothetical protein
MHALLLLLLVTVVLDMVQDAVLVPCCQGSACDSCTREALAAKRLQVRAAMNVYYIYIQTRRLLYLCILQSYYFTLCKLC